MKFRKLLSYKLDNDSTLEYSTTVKGMGRVQINGETVSEKIGIRTEIHSFDYNNSSYVLSLSPLFSLYTLGYRFELIRDDVQLFLCGEKGLDDVLLVGGGIIPKKDMVELEREGVGKLFGPGTPVQDTINYITAWVNTNRWQNES